MAPKASPGPAGASTGLADMLNSLPSCLGEPMIRPLRAWLAATSFVALAILPASADIRAFNDKVTARDFKAAAAEAAATWPSLDKSRKDIAVIAREFGFAAYMAGEYAAARAFAQFALDYEAAGAQASDQGSSATVLEKLAAFKQQPGPPTRNELFGVLLVRAGAPGLDIVSYLGLDATLAYDFEKGAWNDARSSSALGEQLTSSGGRAYLLHNRRFQLFKGVATYMSAKRKTVFDDLTRLVEVMKADIEAAPTEAEAEALAQFYWEVVAWRETIGSHLVGRDKMKWPKEDADEESRSPTPRQVKYLRARPDSLACKAKPDFRRPPKYPDMAVFKGLIGTVILAVDVDAEGRASNPKVLAAVPDKPFGEAVLNSVKDLSYAAGEPWGPSCSLAQAGRVIHFQFKIR